MERAKSSLLVDKLENDGEADDGNRQSDHLLMMVAYNKWAKILHEVRIVIFQLKCIICSSSFLW